MGWFSPIKGHYPSLSQLDKTLPVEFGESNEAIRRGMIIEMTADDVNAAGVFKLAADATNDAMLYIALQDYTDAQAGMAGTTGFDGNVPPITEGNISIPGATAGVPAITGLSLSMEGEYETSEYTGLESARVGDPLTVKNGKLTAIDNPADPKQHVVAYLMSAPYSRWVNNAVAKPVGADARSGAVVRLGASQPVIRFRTK